MSATRSLLLMGMQALARDFGKERVVNLFADVQARVTEEAKKIIRAGQPQSPVGDAWIASVISILLLKAGADALAKEMQAEMGR